MADIPVNLVSRTGDLGTYLESYVPTNTSWPPAKSASILTSINLTEGVWRLRGRISLNSSSEVAIPHADIYQVGLKLDFSFILDNYDFYDCTPMTLAPFTQKTYFTEKVLTIPSIGEPVPVSLILYMDYGNQTPDCTFFIDPNLSLIEATKVG